MEVIKIKKNNQDQKVFHEKDISDSKTIENPDAVIRKSIPQKILDIEEMLKETIKRISNLEEGVGNIEDEIKSDFSKLSSTFNFYDITEQIQNLTNKFDNLIQHLNKFQSHTKTSTNTETKDRSHEKKDMDLKEKSNNEKVYEAQVLEDELKLPNEDIPKKILNRLIFQIKERPYELDRNFLEILKSFLEKNPQEISTVSPLIYSLLGKLDVDQEIILEAIRLLDYLRQKIKEKSQFR